MTTEECRAEVDGVRCGRRTKALGLCSAHYRMQANGEPFRAVGVYRRYATPAPGKKVCTNCERVLDVERDFYKRDKTDKPKSYCKTCTIKKQQERNAERAAS